MPFPVPVVALPSGLGLESLFFNLALHRFRHFPSFKVLGVNSRVRWSPSSNLTRNLHSGTISSPIKTLSKVEEVYDSAIKAIDVARRCRASCLVCSDMDRGKVHVHCIDGIGEDDESNETCSIRECHRPNCTQCFLLQLHRLDPFLLQLHQASPLPDTQLKKPAAVECHPRRQDNQI